MLVAVEGGLFSLSELVVVAAVVLVSVVASVLASASLALVMASKCSTLTCTWAGALEVKDGPGMRGSLSDGISPSSKCFRSLKRTVGMVSVVPNWRVFDPRAMGGGSWVVSR